MTTSPYDNLPTGKKELDTQNTGYEEVILDTQETSEKQVNQNVSSAKDTSNDKTAAVRHTQNQTSPINQAKHENLETPFLQKIAQTNPSVEMPPKPESVTVSSQSPDGYTQVYAAPVQQDEENQTMQNSEENIPAFSPSASETSEDKSDFKEADIQASSSDYNKSETINISDSDSSAEETQKAAKEETLKASDDINKNINSADSKKSGSLKYVEVPASSRPVKQENRAGSDILRTTPMDKSPVYSKSSVKNRCSLREYILPFEESLLVPDTMPDMAEIFFTEGKLSLVQNNKASYEFGDTLSGEITLYTVYRPDSSSDSPVDVIKSSIPFKTDKCWSGDENSTFKVTLLLKSSRAEFINERKFAAKGEISIRITEISKKELNIFKSIDDTDFVKQESTVSITDLNFETEELAEISQEIKINEEQPEPAKILKQTINIAEAHKQITSGKLVINAVINTQILYIGQDEGENKLCSITNKTDFTQFILIKENTDVNLIKADFNSDDLKISIDNNSGFMLEGQVRILIQGYENKEVGIISDAYHKEKDITFDISSQSVSNVKETLSGEISAREVINADESSRKPQTILCGSLLPENISGRLDGSRVIIEGSLPVKILALDEDDRPFIIESSVPLRGSLDASSSSDKPEIDVWASVKDFWVDNINSRQIEVNVSVTIDVWISSQQNFTTIENICFAEKRETEKRVSMAIYVVGRHDTLWDIAKKYKSDINTLAEFNQIDPQMSLPEGMKLLIAK